MRTKLEAGKIAIGGGTHMIIAAGKRAQPAARRSAQARRCDLVPRPAPIRCTARKRWIAGQLEPAGR